MTFLAALTLGALSGSITHGLTGDPTISWIVAIVVALVTSLGLACVAIFDD
jgi:ABC-type uncharacterized transport system permease subunit